MLKRARLLCSLVLWVSRAVLSVVLGAWSVRFVGWADWVDCRCFLSFVFLGVARRLELSPCTTPASRLVGVTVSTGQTKRGSCGAVFGCINSRFRHSTVLGGKTVCNSLLLA